MATQKILKELNTKETPEPKDPGLIRMEDVMPYTTAERKEEYVHKYQVCGLWVNFISIHQNQRLPFITEI